MQKLISELTRLFLLPGSVAPDALMQGITGQAAVSVPLVSDGGMVRAMVIDFPKGRDDLDARHWTRLCELAAVLQNELGLPAPAVSVSAVNGYRLWLSLAAPVPAPQAQRFMELLHQAYFPDFELRADAATAAVELPPSLNQATGRWAAFIHPGMGASFADESGLEMAPPLAGQAAFLEGLHCIGEAEFGKALASLQDARATEPAAPARVAGGVVTPEGLLLKDATLEDIVRFLHAKNIEPTFRHLIA